MKKFVIVGALIVLVALGAGLMYHPESKWSGVDESVVKKFAEEAGRPPRDPYINVAQGDLALLFSGGRHSGWIRRGVPLSRALSATDQARERLPACLTCFRTFLRVATMRSPVWTPAPKLSSP